MSVADRVTLAVFCATAVGWIVWDVLAPRLGGKTESWWLAKLGREWNALPFLLGALVGHWFLQTPAPDYALWPIALALAVVVLAYDLLCRPWSAKGATVRLVEPAGWMRYPGLWLLLGTLTGGLFWGQRLP